MNRIALYVLIALLPVAACKNSKRSKEKAETRVEKEASTKAKKVSVAETADKDSQPEPAIGDADHDQGATSGENGKRSKYQPHIADDLYFGMYTSPCFGNCPVFNLDIDITGRAVLEGKRFFDYEGFFVTELSETQMIRILNLANEYGYSKFDDVYDDPNVTDLPSVTTILRTPGGVKWAYNRMGAPDALNQFQQEVITLIKEWQWKPMESHPSNE